MNYLFLFCFYKNSDSFDIHAFLFMKNAPGVSLAAGGSAPNELFRMQT